MEPIRLKTFPKPKYLEQIVAIDNGPGSMNMAIFDACKIFMQDDTWAERQRVAPQAKEFAERFVAQMNVVALECEQRQALADGICWMNANPANRTE